MQRSTLVPCMLAAVTAAVLLAIPSSASASAHTHSPSPSIAEQIDRHARTHSLSHPVSSVEDAKSAFAPDWRLSLYDGMDRHEGITPNNDPPTQIKLSFHPTGMAVSWKTVYEYSEGVVPTVHYGVEPQSLKLTATGPQGRSYGTSYFHTVLLEQLNGGERYFYRVEGDSEVRTFVTAKAAGDDSPFEIVVVGDMGLQNSHDTIEQMKAVANGTHPADWILHIGDLSYADDFFLRPNNTYEGSWDTWQDLMEPITSTLPYMTLPGNHEVTCTEVTPFLCPPQQRNFTAYRYRVRMPCEESGGMENLWYSFDYGLVHFVQIDTESDFPNSPMGPSTWYNAGPFGDQLAWLEKDLIKAVEQRKAGVTPWIVVSGHRPWYTSDKAPFFAEGHHRDRMVMHGDGKPLLGPCQSCQNAFEQLLVKYDVDIYFAGHVHWYERQWPMTLGGKVTQHNYDEPQGIVYLVSGSGGNVEGHSTGSPLPYTAFIDQSNYGFGRMLVANSSAIRWQFIRAQDGGVADEIWIKKTH